MSSELVEVHPSTLNFTFALRKQSTCLVQVINKSDQFVAFKVKTTSPKKYVVKPNIRVLKPKGSSDFTVIMVAQSVAPPDLQCKDKFLIQSTIVPFGLTEENITSEMFVKDPSKHIEDKKLKVTLVADTNTEETPVSPINVVQNQVLIPDASPAKDKTPTGLETPPPFKDVEGSKTSRHTEELRPTKHAEPRPAEEMELRMARSLEPIEVQKSNEVSHDDVDLKSRKQADKLSLKITELASKLAKVEQVAAHITDDRNKILHEKESIQQELAFEKKKNVVKKVYMGYPLIYVCMASLFSLTFGYLMRQ